MEQFNIFGELYKELPIVKSIKLGTFFSGIGAPEKALGNIGVDFDLQFFSEIDKYAIKAYCAIHGESEDKCIGSISELKGIDLPYCDMWFGGFPCPDISLAGNGKGFVQGSKTRSSLGWEMIRLASEVKIKPKYIVFENVAAIFNKIHRPILNLFKQDLEKLGYTLHNQLLSSKDRDIPQNRNRYFLIAILGEYNYTFPKIIDLNNTLANFIEKDFDRKLIIKESLFNRIVVEQKKEELIIVNNTLKGFISGRPYDGVILNQLTGAENNKGSRGRVQKGVSPTLKTSKLDCGVITETLEIRHFSPLEFYRLQSFTDEDFYKAQSVISDAQLYKTAGNSINVKVLEAIFKNLFL